MKGIICVQNNKLHTSYKMKRIPTCCLKYRTNICEFWTSSLLIKFITSDQKLNKNPTDFVHVSVAYKINMFIQNFKFKNILTSKIFG